MFTAKHRSRCVRRLTITKYKQQQYKQKYDRSKPGNLQRAGMCFLVILEAQKSSPKYQHPARASLLRSPTSGGRRVRSKREGGRERGREKPGLHSPDSLALAAAVTHS